MFEKIHVPDCANAFNTAKAVGGKIGNCIGTGAIYAGEGAAIFGVFVGVLIGNAAWGLVKALPTAVMAVGRFVEDAIGNDAHKRGIESTGTFDMDFRDWSKHRRSA